MKKNKPPVVVVLGHVDHGKSSLLEAIKDLKITQKESGGITQHIGAYFIEHKEKGITFIDTPGHEAFFAMRSRGTTVADIGILVVAADEGVKTQTKEAIEHIKEAGIPFLVAINKTDKKEADTDKTKQGLSVEGIFVESFGGKTPSVNISAKTKEGIDDLLEMILLLAEMEELKCNPELPAEGVVVETNLDKRKGLSITLLVKNGTLKKGDVVGTLSSFGNVRTMESCTGKEIESAGPSVPVSITGIRGEPFAGESFVVYNSQEEARKAVEKKDKEEVEKTDTEEFTVILKADTSGSLEAIKSSIDSIPRDKIAIRVVSSGVGDVNETDVLLAKTTGSSIFAFHVKTDRSAQSIMLRDKIEVKNFEIIYELMDSVKEEASRKIAPEIVRTEVGKIQVLAVFRTKGNRQILGGKVIKGEALRGAMAEIWKGEEKKGEGKIVNLKKEEKDIEKAPNKEEIGLLFEGKGKAEEGDALVIFKEEEVITSL